MSNSGIIGPRQTFTGTTAGGINTLTDAQVLKSGNLWPTAPDAPTSVSATASGSGALAVAFTAPSYVGSSAITAYRVTASTGQTATGSSSPITVSGLTSGDTVTCTVAAQNAVGFGPESSASSGVLIPSAQNYTTAGTHSFTVPAGVTSISVAAIGGGGGGYGSSSNPGSGGGGGAFMYANNVSVTAGQVLTVAVGAGGTGSINPTGGGNSAVYNASFTNFVLAGGGSAASASSGGAGGNAHTGTGFAGGSGGPKGGNYGSGGNGGGGGGGAGGKTSAGGTGADAGQGNPPYNNATHGSASGGSGGLGGGTSGYMGGGVAFETTNIVQTSMYSQPNMPSVASVFHSGSPNHYGGGGGGAYHTGGAPKNGQGGAVQIKWGGATY